MEIRLTESAWCRGWRDTKSGWLDWRFIVFEAIMTPLLGFVLEWWWSIAVVAGGMLCIWIGATVSAPVKQRNEARRLLQAKPKPMPLRNREKLIEAIIRVENTTMALMGEQDLKVNEAFTQWEESFNLLRTQYLIAGDEYERIALGFKDFVWIRVMAKMQIIGFNIGDQPWVFGNLGIFTGELGRKVKETIQKIDDLSEPTTHKESSLTE